MPNETAEATFAAGCFWGVEAAFQKMPGVIKTETGYSGGTFMDPTYEDVMGKTTGHAESVRVVYDPAKTSYEKLLKLFWFIHDPTQVNRQGNDVGPQYRSVVFYHTEAQREEAEYSKLEESKRHSEPIATSIEPAASFWTAEEYHQKYLDKNPSGYCHVSLPAVERFLKTII